MLHLLNLVDPADSYLPLKLLSGKWKEQREHVRRIKSGLAKSFSKGNELLFRKRCTVRAVISEPRLPVSEIMWLGNKGSQTLLGAMLSEAPSKSQESDKPFYGVFFCLSPQSLERRRKVSQEKAWRRHSVSCSCYPGFFAASAEQSLAFSRPQRHWLRHFCGSSELQLLPSQPVLSRSLSHCNGRGTACFLSRHYILVI